MQRPSPLTIKDSVVAPNNKDAIFLVGRQQQLSPRGVCSLRRWALWYVVIVLVLVGFLQTTTTTAFTIQPASTSPTTSRSIQDFSIHRVSQRFAGLRYSFSQRRTISNSFSKRRAPNMHPRAPLLRAQFNNDNTDAHQHDETSAETNSHTSTSPPRAVNVTNASASSPSSNTGRRHFLSASAALASALASFGHGDDAELARTAIAAVLGDPTPPAATTTAPKPSSATSYYNPVVPFSSVRRYQSLTLPNGLSTLLVSERIPTTPTAASTGAAARRNLWKSSNGLLASSNPPLSSAALYIGGAGQWSDPAGLPGCAHLMEHMILSAPPSSSSSSGRSTTTMRQQQQQQQQEDDFEDWLGRNGDGSSNGFTAYDSVCLHFTCDSTAFPPALERFANLLTWEHVQAVSRGTGGTTMNPVLKREIRRIQAEFENLDDVYYQAICLTKDLIEPESHPYSRFSLGNANTLEEIPLQNNIDVGQYLRDFFQRYYLPQQAVLVVLHRYADPNGGPTTSGTGTPSMANLMRWVQPFGNTLSRRQQQLDLANKPSPAPRFYPGGFLQGNRLKHIILARKNQQSSSLGSGVDDTLERLSFEWVLDCDYRNMEGLIGRPSASPALGSPSLTVTASQLGFLISQIVERRGPGSLYAFLLRRAWVPSTGSAGVPRVSIPVDVSGFQILKMDLTLTREGFLNRDAVVAAVYDCLDALRGTNSVFGGGGGKDSFVLRRELVTQWATVAKLFGYALTSRPPDAIELAQDVQMYGMEVVTSGKWYRFPSPEDSFTISQLRKSLASTLEFMSNPENAVVIVTASNRVIDQETNKNLPALAKWNTVRNSEARFIFEDMMGLKSRIEELVLTRLIDREELLPPVPNPLIPLTLRPARSISSPKPSLRSRKHTETGLVVRYAPSSGRSRDQVTWLLALPGDNQRKLSLPRGPREPTSRAVFVMEFVSSRPARAGPRQAAQGELWKVSFELAMADLAELGAPGGLAYEISFNKFGMRLVVLGISQTLPSYTRRLCRRLVKHQSNLQNGPEIFPQKVTTTAVAEVRRARGLSQQRRRQLISSIRRSTAYEAAAEGTAFLNSVNAVFCFSQGDLLRDETESLMDDLREILRNAVGSGASVNPTKRAAALPDVEDLVYQPAWRPRSASPCAVAGVPLISDACGRVPR